MAGLIEKRYGNALFELAVEDGIVQEIFDECVFLSDLIQNNQEFKTVILNPKLTGDEKLKFINSVFEGKLSVLMIGTIQAVVLKKRLSSLYFILQYYIKRTDEYLKRTTAKVVSAVKLSDLQLSEIKNNLEVKLNKTVNIINVVDESVIGGLYISVDGYIIDSTIKRQLRDIKAIAL